MSAASRYGQKCKKIPRTDECNPMKWVSCSTASEYEAVTVTPEQAFQIVECLTVVRVHLADPCRSHRTEDQRGSWSAAVGHRLDKTLDPRSSCMEVRQARRTEIKGKQGRANRPVALQEIHQTMLRELNDPDAKVRSATAWIPGQSGGEDMIPALKAVAETDPHRRVTVNRSENEPRRPLRRFRRGRPLAILWCLNRSEQKQAANGNISAHQKRSLTPAPLGLSVGMSPLASAKLRRTTQPAAQQRP